jgi:hypothetical protein
MASCADVNSTITSYMALQGLWLKHAAAPRKTA